MINKIILSVFILSHLLFPSSDIFRIIASANIVLASAIWASKISSSGMGDKFMSGRTVISIGPLSRISGEDRSLLLTCKLSDENNNENTNNVNRILIINSFYRFFEYNIN